jgi:hypothetical protein
MNFLTRRLFRSLTTTKVDMAPSQLAKAVLMVRPVDFAFNPETAKDNEFMKKS